MNEKVLFAWSGGKDSAMALYEVMRGDRYDVTALLTTVTESYKRVSMHGVREELLDIQARALGLLQEKVYITKEASNEEYESEMGKKLTEYRDRGVRSVVFGDIFLEDLRGYRESNLARVGMKGIFPVWKRDTGGLAREFIDLGFEAVVTCVDTKHLDRSFSGRRFDERFILDLPRGVDPCGENGEFHTFVYDGPIFKGRLALKSGETVMREGRFCFCDLTLELSDSPALSLETRP